ncbi:Eco57I restriction-modification methylase domain-containing protein [Jeotgalicoccus psychrophilus]|uniref:Eco57I restriction-modification methylase domain-containing protein n=1 Tax=Jeotgalicoccus psychrophilus TaxID=157228 RepID=UPI00040A45CD|nr:N-6 DNA methylase [Jeotgalicoccus psychrophilus]
MESTNKRINQFYRDYKKINEYIYINSDLSRKEIAKIINYEIVNQFLEHEEISSNNGLYKLLSFEKPDMDYNLFLSYIQNIVHKYSWSLKEEKNSLTPDIIGRVFEKYVNQRENGAYYTDEDTIQYILDSSILWALLNKLNAENKIKVEFMSNFTDSMNESNEKKVLFEKVLISAEKHEVYELLDVLKEFKVADISVGTGAFLVATIEYLTEVYVLCCKAIEKTLDIHSTLMYIMEKIIHGIDIMPDALDIARFRVILKSIQILQKYNMELKEIPKLNFYEQNSLTYNNWSSIISDKSDRFDCIVGNPPYVEYSKIQNYELENYETKKSGNLYAFMIEKSISLLTEDGVLGLIVPISLVSTLRMSYVREYLYKNMNEIFIANFADRPGTLFNGVHQKLSIVIAKKNQTVVPKIYTTSYIHWYEKERDNLFKNIKYRRNIFETSEFIFKYGNQIEEEILKKVTSNETNILSMTSPKGQHPLSMSTRMTFWMKAFPVINESSEYKKLFFEDIKVRNLFYLLLNSDIFYFYWESISDGWHITNKELKYFKFDFNKLTELSEIKINKYTKLLEDDIERNKEFIGTKQADYSFKHKKSKEIIDEINLLLGSLFDLTTRELEYLRQYNLSYRMNDELENYNSRRP